MKGLTTDSDVLPAPQLVGEPGIDLQGPLGSAQQALLLAMAEQVKRSTSAGEGGPFAAALTQQMLPVSTASCIKARSSASAWASMFLRMLEAGALVVRTCRCGLTSSNSQAPTMEMYADAPCSYL